MNRIPFVPENTDDQRIAPVFERLRKRWQGAPILHLYRVLAWAPSLMAPWCEFAGALRFKSTVPAALRELMIVRSGQLTHAEYEWKHHWIAAIEEGVSKEKLRALESWHTTPLFSSLERAVLALAEETALETGASESTINALKAHFSNEQVVELVMIAGFYTGVARIVNSLGISIEPGFEAMTPRDEMA